MKTFKHIREGVQYGGSGGSRERRPFASNNDYVAVKHGDKYHVVQADGDYSYHPYSYGAHDTEELAKQHAQQLNDHIKNLQAHKIPIPTKLIESMGSVARAFMKKKNPKDVKYDASWHIRPQGKTLDRPNTSVEPKKALEEGKIKDNDPDHLKLLKLQNMALRAFPSSPKQKEIQSQIKALKEKMKREGTPEYFPKGKGNALSEGLTGPTRMQLQQHFDKETGSLRARIYKTEKAHNVHDIRVNSQGDIIHFKENPKHEYHINPSDTGHQTHYAFHLEETKKKMIKVSTKQPIGYRVAEIGPGGKEHNVKEVNWKTHVKEEFDQKFNDHTTNKFHKVLTKHGFIHHETHHENNFTPTTHHIYRHPAHGKSHVEVTRFHSGGSDHFVHRHEQKNGIIGPYASGETKPHLDRHLADMYGKPLKEGAVLASIVREAFEKGKDKKAPRDDQDQKKDDSKEDKPDKGTFPPKKDKSGSDDDQKKSPFPPKKGKDDGDDQDDQGDDAAQKKKATDADLKKDDDDDIELSGKKEKVNVNPTVSSMNYMDYSK